MTCQPRPADEKHVEGHRGKFLGPEIPAPSKGKLQRLQCGCTTRKATEVQHRKTSRAHAAKMRPGEH